MSKKRVKPVKDPKNDQLLQDAIRAKQLGVSYGYYIGALKVMTEFAMGQLLKVKKEQKETFDKKWITKDDIVRVIGIYPHHILVEKVKAGRDNWHMRESFSLNGIKNDLEVFE